MDTSGFDRTRKMADALDRMEIPYTWHKVIPFIGELTTVPTICDSNAVVMFGSYVPWRYVLANDLGRVWSLCDPAEEGQGCDHNDQR